MNARTTTNIKPSIRSKIPPWPGKIFPVSLIFSNLLKYEIVKSPIWVIKEKIIARKKKLGSKKLIPIVSGTINFSIRNKENKENINEPKTPEKVFFGLILVNLFHLNIFPKAYPPISDNTPRIITHIRT